MVYVDDLLDWGWKYGRSCHMVADSIEELHEFANKIGMKRDWFQDNRIPHYDLTEKKRTKAIKLGAVPLNRREFVDFIKRYK